MDHHNPQQLATIAGYRLDEKLGSGSFANVYKGVKLNDPTDVTAIKVISLQSDKLTKKVLANLKVEISILQNIHHHHIVSMKQSVSTEAYFYMILEYCAGGDVQHLIRSRDARRLSERLVRRLMRDLADGLGFLWNQELIHRDIKPQNLLLTCGLPDNEAMENPPAVPPSQANQSFCLKIADFGFARHLQSTSLAETLCGSPLYMAPEILQHQRYDAKADLWSVGTVLFEMITGNPPFHGENHIDLLRNIQRKSVRLPKDVKVSKECVNLLRILLCRNPLQRAGFQEFFAANEAFVALGCNGIPRSSEPFSRMAPIPEDTNIVTTTTTRSTAKPRLANIVPVTAPRVPQTTVSSTLQAIELPTRRNDEIPQTLQNSMDDGSFVMVEAAVVSQYDTRRLAPSPPSGFFLSPTKLGILSTSPRTGGALMGGDTTARTTTPRQPPLQQQQQQIELQGIVKTLATAEDIGRRAICVAHLGDVCARRAITNAPENDDDHNNAMDDTASRSLEHDDDMPFALQQPVESKPFSTDLVPSRAAAVSFHSKEIQPKADSNAARRHLSETLTCYVKAMSMLKGAVGVLQTVSREVDLLLGRSNDTTLHQIKKRTEVTRTWLVSQFKCLLERGEATNGELGKLQKSAMSYTMPNADELLYTNSLAFGREGAAKQLLGQMDGARSCYRSAGLLMETLLMENRIQGDDRKTLESYVDGFASQIREIDEMSRADAASAASGYTPMLPNQHPFSSLSLHNK